MTRMDNGFTLYPFLSRFSAACSKSSLRLLRGGVPLLAGLVFIRVVLGGGTAGAQGLTVAPNVDVQYFMGNENDADIAVNPLNTNDLFIAGNTNINTGIFGLYSTNGGGMGWSPSTLTNVPPGADPSVAWDGYGNLFLAYINGSFATASFSGIEIDVSTNGGQSFIALTNLAAGDTALQPRIAVGVGPGLGSLWVSYKNYNLANGPVIVQGLPVTGLGEFGAFGAAEIVSGSMINCGSADLAVGPSGEVLVAFQTNDLSAGAAAIYVNLNAGGLGTNGTNGFGTPVLATASTIGGDTRIAAQPDYGINSAADLAYNCDPASAFYGQVYLAYVGQGTKNSKDTDIFLRSSTNDGKSWSAATKVNDDAGTNHQFMPRIAVDPGDGIIAMSWYDCRNDLGATFTTNSVTVTNYSYSSTINTDGSTNINTNIIHTLMVTSSSSGVDALPDDDAMVYAAVSANGGVTFSANKLITSASFTTNGYEATLAHSPNDFGDYTSLVFCSNTFYALWPDNSGSAGANLDSPTKTNTTYITNVSIVMYGSNADQLTISNAISTNMTTTLVESNFDITFGKVTLTGLADVSVIITLNDTNTLVLGATPSYTVTVSNAGPNAANNTALTETFLPAATDIFYASSTNGTYQFNTNTLTWSIGTVAANATASIVVSIIVGNSSAITNQATVTSASLDLFPTNNSFSLVAPVAFTADLALTLSASTSSVGLGGLVTYTLDVTNLGPLTAPNVVVSNTLPGNFGLSGLTLPEGVTCLTNQNLLVFQIASLADGQGDSIGLTLTATGYGIGTDSAVVFSGISDTNTANNSASASTDVPAPPPAIANVTVAVVSATAAIITWDSAAASTGQVAYGLTTAYSSVSWMNPALVTHHVVLLTGLLPNTNYFFQVKSVAGGVLSTSPGAFATISSLIIVTEQADYSGPWTTDGAASAYQGEYRFTQGVAGDATASATYTPAIALSGNYDISVWYPTNTSFSASTPMVITGATNQVVATVNQSINGGNWVTIATGIYFAQGTGGSLTIENNEGATNNVVANAAQWTYSLTQDAPTNGVVPGWWSTFYFGSNNVVSSADPDHDGYSNYAEYVFGTDPTSATSQLQFSVSPASSTNILVNFAPYQGGRLYQLQSASSALNPVWLTLTNTPVQNATGAGVFTVNHGAGAAVFYRLSATPLP